MDFIMKNEKQLLNFVCKNFKFNKKCFLNDRTRKLLIRDDLRNMKLDFHFEK